MSQNLTQQSYIQILPHSYFSITDFIKKIILNFHLYRKVNHSKKNT